MPQPTTPTPTPTLFQCSNMHARLSLRACGQNQARAMRAADKIMQYVPPARRDVHKQLPNIRDADLDCLWCCATCPRATMRMRLQVALARWDGMWRGCVRAVEGSKKRMG